MMCDELTPRVVLPLVDRQRKENHHGWRQCEPQERAGGSLGVLVSFHEQNFKLGEPSRGPLHTFSRGAVTEHLFCRACRNKGQTGNTPPKRRDEMRREETAVSPKTHIQTHAHTRAQATVTAKVHTADVSTPAQVDITVPLVTCIGTFYLTRLRAALIVDQHVRVVRTSIILFCFHHLANFEKDFFHGRARTAVTFDALHNEKKR